jgi:peptidylprolyl isomerase
MRILKQWLKTSTLLLLVVSLSLLSAVWALPSNASPIAALPPGNAITDPRALLRLALPIDNQPVRDVQTYLEDISTQLPRKRWGTINTDVSKASRIARDRQDQILASVPEERRAQAETLIESIQASFEPLKAAADAKDKEQLSKIQSETLDLVGELEELMVQKFPFEVPADYNNLPQLKGRATIEMKTTKGPITFVVDGYNAPVTAGNFVDLVQQGFYDGLEFTRTEQLYIAQAGDPPGPEDGFIDPKTGKSRTIPLEVLVQGDSKPTYGITLEDAGRYQDKPALPFSAYGTVAMARPGDDPNGASSQFFFFLFEPSLTPAGLNLLDGRYAVFGYVIEGQDTLDKLKLGDKIESAKVIQGAEHLVQPQAA